MASRECTGCHVLACRSRETASDDARRVSDRDDGKRGQTGFRGANTTQRRPSERVTEANSEAQRSAGRTTGPGPGQAANRTWSGRRARRRGQVGWAPSPVRLFVSAGAWAGDGVGCGWKRGAASSVVFGHCRLLTRMYYSMYIIGTNLLCASSRPSSCQVVPCQLVNACGTVHERSWPPASAVHFYAEAESPVALPSVPPGGRLIVLLLPRSPVMRCDALLLSFAFFCFAQPQYLQHGICPKTYMGGRCVLKLETNGGDLPSVTRPPPPALGRGGGDGMVGAWRLGFCL